MAKGRATVDTNTGEVSMDNPLIAPDLRELEKKIAAAHGDFLSKKEISDEANYQGEAA